MIDNPTNLTDWHDNETRVIADDGGQAEGPGHWPVLLEADIIADRVAGLADVLSERYRRERAKVVHMVVLMDGAFMFAADLMRRMTCPVIPHFFKVSSYQGTKAGKVRCDADALERLVQDLRNRHVLVVDDILDTGATLDLLLRALRPVAITYGHVVLLDKQKVPNVPEYQLVGFEIRDEFVVGYGMDHDGRHRELACVKVMPEANR